MKRIGISLAALVLVAAFAISTHNSFAQATPTSGNPVPQIPDADGNPVPQCGPPMCTAR